MSVRISISNHERNTTYYPGDTIDGRVYLRGPLRDENLSVSIKFWGSTYSEISLDKHSTRHYLQLCKVQRELFAGSCSLGEGAELSFPFSLTIPKYTFNYGGHRKNKYWAASAHDLPPTVATHGFRFDGRIGYELHAEARKSTFFSINTHKPCLQAIEQTLALQKSSTFKLPSLWRRNDKSSNESELIHQSTTLKVQVPSSMELGNPISMALEVVHDGQDANPLLIPEMHLLSIKHNIETRTYVRVLGLAKDDDSGIKQFLVGDFIEWKNKKLRFKQENLERVLRPREMLDLAKELCLIIPESQLPSSFKSSGISRLYSSKTTVKVECEGKKHKVIFKIPGLKVRPVKGSGSAVPEPLITEKV